MDIKTTKGVKMLGFMGIFLIVAAGFMLVMQPLMAQNAKFSKQIEMAETEQSTASSKLDNLRKQVSDIDQVEQLDDNLSKEFPGYSDTPELLNMVRTIANQSGLEDKDITNLTAGIPAIVNNPGGTAGTVATPPPGEEGAAAAPVPGATGNSNVAETTISITVEGSFENLSTFAENLKDSKLNLKVNSLNINEGSDDKAKGSADISATTYIYQTVEKVTPEQEPAK